MINRQNNNLYLPWYREERKAKFLGFELEHTNKLVHRIILPWEIDDGSSFSGTATREAFIEKLKNTEKSRSVIAYSFSCREMANGLLEMDDETLSLIKSADFVAPNIHPLESIRRMDWASSDLEKPLDIEEYLNGDPEDVFSRLMQPVGNSEIWAWDPIQFQKDLQKYHEEDLQGNDFSAKINQLRNLWIKCNIYISKKDQIVNPEIPIRLSNTWKIMALSWHRPKSTIIQDVIKEIAT